MAYLVTASEYLEVGTFPLATPAGRLTSLAPLWTLTYRGANRLIPGVAGRTGYPRRHDEVRVNLNGVIWGDLDSEGNAHPSVREGLALNMEELYTQVLEPVSTGDGTRAATWHRADGNVEAGIQVVDFDVTSKGPTTYLYRMAVVIPAGLWTPVAP